MIHCTNVRQGHIAQISTSNMVVSCLDWLLALDVLQTTVHPAACEESLSPVLQVSKGQARMQPRADAACHNALDRPLEVHCFLICQPPGEAMTDPAMRRQAPSPLASAAFSACRWAAQPTHGPFQLPMYWVLASHSMGASSHFMQNAETIARLRSVLS